MNQSKIIISPETHWQIYGDSHPRYQLIETTTLKSHQHRHGYGGEMVFKDTETDKLYKTDWRDSSNERNSWTDLNYRDQECHQVKQVQELKTTYQPINSKEENLKTYTIQLTNIKDPDRFNELCWELDISEKLQDKYFAYGEYANLELTFDQKLNIASAQLLKK